MSQFVELLTYGSCYKETDIHFFPLEGLQIAAINWCGFFFLLELYGIFHFCFVLFLCGYVHVIEDTGNEAF